jgi:hypothetical protein
MLFNNNKESNMKGKQLLVVWVLSVLFVLYWFLQYSFQSLNGSDLQLLVFVVGSAVILIYLIPWQIKVKSEVIKSILTIKKQMKNEG